MLAIPLIVVLILLRGPMQPEGVRVSMICGGIVFILLAWLAEWMYISVHYSRSANAYFLADTAAGFIIIVLIYFRRKSARNSKSQDQR